MEFRAAGIVPFNPGALSAEDLAIGVFLSINTPHPYNSTSAFTSLYEDFLTKYSLADIIKITESSDTASWWEKVAEIEDTVLVAQQQNEEQEESAAGLLAAWAHVQWEWELESGEGYEEDEKDNELEESGLQESGGADKSGEEDGEDDSDGEDTEEDGDGGQADEAAKNCIEEGRAVWVSVRHS